jgi:hypothetical protein
MVDGTRASVGNACTPRHFNGVLRADRGRGSRVDPGVKKQSSGWGEKYIKAPDISIATTRKLKIFLKKPVECGKLRTLIDCNQREHGACLRDLFYCIKKISYYSYAKIER